jgi:hypothetical protein
LEWLRPLSWAKHEAVIKPLVKAKADNDAKDDENLTPLALAAENGNEALIKLLQSGEFKLLLLFTLVSAIQRAMGHA